MRVIDAAVIFVDRMRAEEHGVICETGHGRSARERAGLRLFGLRTARILPNPEITHELRALV